MKTTLDLPDDLMLEVKMQAVRKNVRLKQAVADLLRRALAQPEQPTLPRTRVRLPLIPASPGQPPLELTSERIHDLEAQAERSRHDASLR